MPKRLVKLRVTEGSVVPRGANQRAHIRLFKMHTHDDKPQPRTSLWSKIARPFAKKEQQMTKLEEIKKRLADRKAARIAKTAATTQTPPPAAGATSATARVEARTGAREKIQRRLAG